ncbi:protein DETOXIFICATION 29 [Citrus sinensis]|uniref:Protein DETOXIFICATION 29 n=1 Tax=Citrus sinensis TaxID=2711 RepID=A0ACB8LIG1_CITSI|nr:protein DETOXIFICATION 29 [Citrus sinensis]
MEDNAKQPLISPLLEEEDQEQNRNPQNHLLVPESLPAVSTAVFTAGTDDIPPINGVRDFSREFLKEGKKLWYLAGPAIFMTICQYSLGAITQVFSGHISTLALAAVSVENSVIAGFSFGAMLGMGSALETLCGQAYGAGQLDMMGVYLQRSWIILITTALMLMFMYIFAQQLLSLIGQTQEISNAAGTFAIWMIPQLFAYALNFPMVKFLQAQSKIMVLAVIAAVALLLHTILSWLLILKLGLGLVGAAVALNSSWWFIDITRLLYIFSGACGPTWSGFSWKAFHSLWSFVRLSLASAVMLCMNILGWSNMVSIGMNAAVSVRTSNELGAAHPRTAKLSLVVAVFSSFLIGLTLSLILIVTRNQYPALFSSDPEVIDLVIDLTPLLALCIVINNIQPVLSGVAIGAGWQATVAYVNIGCYYLFGIPLGLILGYLVGLEVKGIWCGMLCGTILQTCVIFGIIYKTNWNKEAAIAGDRIRKWGGHTENET